MHSSGLDFLLGSFDFDPLVEIDLGIWIDSPHKELHCSILAYNVRCTCTPDVLCLNLFLNIARIKIEIKIC